MTLHNSRGLLATLILALGLFACGDKASEHSAEHVEDTQAQPYAVLREEDYVALTGCDVSDHYKSSVQMALDYLVFDEGEDKEDISYVRRETKHLFLNLKMSSYNVVDAGCLTPSLHRIGVELGMLVELDATEVDYDQAVRFDLDAMTFPDEQDLIYTLQSRSEYMSSTECIISPSSYRKFHAAFRAFFRNSSDPEEASIQMAAFLSDIRDSRPLPDGSLNPQCLTPGLMKLGKDMGVLNESGKLATQGQ